MTPKDRSKNRYMINFVDHKSNYCRVFLARTKDAVAKKYEHFLFFPRRLLIVGCKYFARTQEENIRILIYSARARVFRDNAAKLETKLTMAKQSECIGQY